jgi:hypothetical protein
MPCHMHSVVNPDWASAGLWTREAQAWAQSIQRDMPLVLPRGSRRARTSASSRLTGLFAGRWLPLTDDDGERRIKLAIRWSPSPSGDGRPCGEAPTKSPTKSSRLQRSRETDETRAPRTRSSRALVRPAETMRHPPCDCQGGGRGFESRRPLQRMAFRPAGSLPTSRATVRGSGPGSTSPLRPIDSCRSVSQQSGLLRATDPRRSLATTRRG